MSRSERPRAAVVLCTRDRPDLLPAALESLGATLGAGDELIVVESGDSAAADALAAVDTEATKLHVRSERREKSIKLNRGIARTNAEILLMTDDDVRVAPSWADAMCAPFGDPAVGIAFGPVSGLTAHSGDKAPIVPPGEAPLTTWDYAHGAAMAVRAAAARDVGGFDERLGPGAPAHGEEHDLLLRLWDRGWRAVIAEAPTVVHLAWRDEGESKGNLLVYERGGGAFVGAALRRHPTRWARLAYHRARYQLRLLRTSPFGPATLRAFAGGLLYGLRLRPWRADRGR